MADQQALAFLRKNGRAAQLTNSLLDRRVGKKSQDRG